MRNGPVAAVRRGPGSRQLAQQDLLFETQFGICEPCEASLCMDCSFQPSLPAKLAHVTCPGGILQLFTARGCSAGGNVE